MHRAYIRAVIVSVVLMSGLFLVGINVEESFAQNHNEKSNNGGSGCANANENSNTCEKNPNANVKNPNANGGSSSSCDTTVDTDCDGMSDRVDLCPDDPMPAGSHQIDTDWDGDGIWNDDEVDPAAICDSTR